MASVFLSVSAVIPPAHASTYVEQKVKCPVGGKTFKYMALASISEWGALPDGMPLGSGTFPVELPQCPTNGLVMYRDFTPQDIAKLTTYIEGPEYQALRAAGETPHYLAYQIAKVLGDPRPYWLLLAAGWEAKNRDEHGARARRYNEEFVAVVRALPAEAATFESIALRVRSANALRELGRFEEAEALRESIRIAPDAGGTGQEAAENRTGWDGLVKALAAPIARKDQSRAPIDMIGDRRAIFRCLAKEAAEKFKQPVPAPLSAFETTYCARPELAAGIAKGREMLSESSR